VADNYVLAVGAHCGDMEISAGMVIAKLARLGKRTVFLHLTPGEKGHKTLDAETYAAQKRIEAVKSAEAFGGEALFLPYKDGELPADETVKFQIADIIRQVKPKVLLAHWTGSMHKDHIAAGEVIPDAVFYAAIRGFERKLPPHGGVTTYYAENWEDRLDFQPEVFVEVEQQDVDRWEEACRKYTLFDGGVSDFDYLTYYKSLARVRGLESMTPSGLAQTFGLSPWSRRRRVAEI
jgi:LmbE family N-acetylglucosaminyl deacetylase